MVRRPDPHLSHDVALPVGRGCVDAWCRKTGEAKGDVLTLEHVWRLALAWYAGRMTEEYHGRNGDEVRRLFIDQGLASDFWQG